MDAFALINSMQHTQGIHKQAKYLMDTAYLKRSTITHPELGAWISKYGERRSGDIPPFIKFASSGLGAGFFPGQYGALLIPDPKTGISNLKSPEGVTEGQIQRSFSLTDALNQEFEKSFSNIQTKNYHQAYADAVKLMSSSDLDVFNVEKESEQTREAYGKDQFGYSCLLARRLIENGIGCVELTHSGWDHHYGIYSEFGSHAGSADRGIAALMSDLKSRGLLESTMVAVLTEFGRDAKLNGEGMLAEVAFKAVKSMARPMNWGRKQ